MKDYFKKYKKVSFYEQVKRNKRLSLVFIVFIVLIIIALGWVIAQVYDPSLVWVFIIFATIFSLLYTLIGFYSGDKIALASVRAYEAKDSKFRRLNDMVHGLALAAGLPKPKVYVMPVKEINAFASGRNPENAVVCVSEGALLHLTKKELEGVLAHEMSHVANYDIRFMTLVVVLVGLITMVAQLFLRSLWFSSGSDNRNPIFLIIGIALAILAPLFATLVQLAISRKREYMADAGAVHLTRDNTGLASALKKIGQFYSKEKSKFANSSVKALFISEPSMAKKLFSSHPPLKDRIKALDRM